MSRFSFALAFVLGAAVVTWIGLGFRDSDPLALTVTVIIAAVYGLGFAELVGFRRSSRQLAERLRQPPAQRDQLDDWLADLPQAIQHTVRRRLDGHPAALPGPQLTPYLSGLLVMLGLLGTFAGMIVTLNGAASALGGSTELSVIRGALAAPIAGLSLAFGTSIAGVAGSAMLGLAATLSRRDRAQLSRQLDRTLQQQLHHLSLDHQRQKAYQALESQAQALPEMVSAMQAMTSRMEQLGDQLGQTLTSNQQDFHNTVGDHYQTLANSVAQSLQHALERSGQLTAERIEPMVRDTMAALSEQAGDLHQRWSDTTGQQLTRLTDTLQSASNQAAEQWRQGIEQQAQAQARTTETWQSALDRQQQQFQATTEQLLARIDQQQQQRHADSAAQLASLSEAFSQATTTAAENWQQTLERQQQAAAEQQQALLESGRQRQQQQAEQMQQWLTELQQSQQTQLNQSRTQLGELGERLQQASARTAEHWQQGLAQQQQSSDALAATLQAALQTHQQRFAQDADQLVANQQQGLDTLVTTLTEQLSQLHAQERERSDAAVQRLQALEATVGRHLGELGSALEAPMTRLIETASETPKAAADAIQQLKAEMIRNSERENQLLEERQRLVSELDGLLESQRQATEGQRQAIERLVSGAGDTLTNLGERFDQLIQNQGEQLGRISQDMAGSSEEVGALSEAFHHAVELFGSANEQLVSRLGEVRQALEAASSRHDEQLAYYVAQAREVIDLSLSSQQEVIDAVAALQRNQNETAGAS